VLEFDSLIDVIEAWGTILILGFGSSMVGFIGVPNKTHPCVFVLLIVVVPLVPALLLAALGLVGLLADLDLVWDIHLLFFPDMLFEEEIEDELSHLLFV